MLLDAIGTSPAAPKSSPACPARSGRPNFPTKGSPRGFLDVFGRPRRESVCECERSTEANLSQSLLLLSSGDLHRKLCDPKGRPAWSRDPRPDAEKIDELYRLAFSRLPSEEERKICLEFLCVVSNKDGIRKGLRIWPGR